MSEKITSNLDDLYYNDFNLLHEMLGETKFGINRESSKIQMCETLECMNCRFFDPDGLCSYRRSSWLWADYVPKPKYKVGDIVVINNEGYKMLRVIHKDTGRLVTASNVITGIGEGKVPAKKYAYDDVLYYIGNIFDFIEE